jgi:hypothetical protein
MGGLRETARLVFDLISMPFVAPSIAVVMRWQCV